MSPRPPVRKRPGRYHHGDLRRALISRALGTIDRHGVEALTLRDLGQSLGVSRTALYRHFGSKQALLAEVCAEGFRLLRHDLAEAWGEGGRAERFQAMGEAYVRFALAHPSHYRVMFGGALMSETGPPATSPDADAFGVLVGAIGQLQAAGIVRGDDTSRLALVAWASVHGLAMLAIDGVITPAGSLPHLTRFLVERVWAAIAVAGSAGPAPSSAEGSRGILAVRGEGST